MKVLSKQELKKVSGGSRLQDALEKLRRNLKWRFGGGTGIGGIGG